MNTNGTISPAFNALRVNDMNSVNNCHERYHKYIKEEEEKKMNVDVRLSL